MGHFVQKSGISLTKVGQKLFLDVKLTEHYYNNYCVACVLLYSTVARLALLKCSTGVCMLKQFELQFNLQDRRAHSVGKLRRCFFLHTKMAYLRHTPRVRILTRYIRVSLQKAGQI